MMNTIARQDQLSKRDQQYLATLAADAAAHDAQRDRLAGSSSPADLLDELATRFGSGQPFSTLKARKWDRESLLHIDGIRFDLDHRGYNIYNLAAWRVERVMGIDKAEFLGSIQVATPSRERRQMGDPQQYDMIDRTELLAWLGQFVDVQATPAPLSPIAEAALDIEAQHGKLGGRLERAVKLAEAGTVTFPHYNTAIDEATGLSTCDCPDRAPWVSSGNTIGILTFQNGKACKHCLAQRLHYVVNFRQEQAAYRKQADRAERRRGRRPGHTFDTVPGDGGISDQDIEQPPTEEYRRMLAQEMARRERVGREQALPAQQADTIEEALGYEDDAPRLTAAQIVAAADRLRPDPEAEAERDRAYAHALRPSGPTIKTSFNGHGW